MSGGEFSMLGLLRMEVEQHGGQLNELFNEVKSGDYNEELIDRIIRALSSLKGAAKLVNVGSIYRLSDSLESLFQTILSNQVKLSYSDFEILDSVLSLTKEISSLEDQDLSSYDENSDALVQLLSQIEKIDLSPSDNIDSEDNLIQKKAEPGRANIDSTMLDMFREEVDNHGSSVSECLLNLEADPTNEVLLEKLMRASHSIKGAARMVGVDVIVKIAHVMEDVFVAAQNKKLHLNDNMIDVLLAANDQIIQIAELPEEQMSIWGVENQAVLQQHVELLNSILNGDTPVVNQMSPQVVAPPDEQITSPAKATEEVIPAAIEKNKENTKPAETADSQSESRVLKITADRWDSMIGLAGEIKVEAGWLVPYLKGMMVMRNKHHEMSALLDGIRDYVVTEKSEDGLVSQVSSMHNKLAEFRHLIVDQMNELDQYERRITNLTERLHRQALSTRMRPFSDGVHGFQRMVRDISRSLKKRVKLVIKGESTLVDREVLEKMEAPLNHIVRNGLDHGIESAEERVSSGKPEQAVITLSASHHEGMLQITVEDDGRGIDTEMLREKVVNKGLVTDVMAASLSDEELLEFLFLPSFSTREQVTDLSGRGVGLDVVMDAIQSMRGRVKIETTLGSGTRFLMRLPLTLSVVPGLLVRISGDYYAFPLSRIVSTAKVHVDDIELIEGHQYATINGENIGLLAGCRVLDLDLEPNLNSDYLSVIIITNHDHTYGVVVDEFVDQRELAVQTMDARIEKIQDVGSCALLEDGSTVLIVDVDDMVRTIELMVKGGRVSNMDLLHEHHQQTNLKHVLVVDDSLTVREVEKKLLEEAGYKVDIAVDGIDGWNAVRAKGYDLVISDIDMPRMNGIELVNMIKESKQYQHIPVIIVSYKDREEDRMQGMDVGADYYLTKGSFHDDSFINAVTDLIGEAS